MVLTVGNNIGHCSQGPVCTSKYRNGCFLQMKNSNKIKEISQEKIGDGATVGDDVGQWFQGAVHISKYGKRGYAK